MKLKTVLSLIALLLYISNSISFVLNEKSYQEEAQNWVASYIYNKDNGLLIPQKDLQLIANLCYFSFQRSYATLQAQQKALSLLSAVWNGWQNITHTRLDPSQETPHTISTTEKKISSIDFWYLHDKHYSVGKTYAHTVETVVNSDILITTKALSAVKKIRSESRAIVAQALINIRKLLGKLFHDPTKKSISCSCKKGFELLNHLWSYIPQLALSSFLKADTLNNRMSQDGWIVLHTVQDVGTKTWKAIEEARASFYLAHCNALYTVFAQSGIKTSNRQIIFDQNGIIPKLNRSKTLPFPLLSL